MLSACNKTGVSQYQQSLCSVDNKGFIFKAETKNNKKHTITISKGSVFYKSTNNGKFTNDLEVTNSFIYTGTRENGEFSYISKSMKDPLHLGIINYLCWSGLKTKYKGKVGFNETITKS